MHHNSVNVFFIVGETECDPGCWRPPILFRVDPAPASLLQLVLEAHLLVAIPFCILLSGGRMLACVNVFCLASLERGRGFCHF